MVFPVWVWELDHKEGWAPENWCFWTMVLEKTLESPLDCKEIQPVHPKGNQSWIFIGRTDAEAEVPVLGPPYMKSRLIRKDPDSGKDWGQEEKGMTEDEMVGWHHRLNGHVFEQALGDVMDRKAWHAAVHGVAKSRTWLSDWTTKHWRHAKHWASMQREVFFFFSCLFGYVFVLSQGKKIQQGINLPKDTFLRAHTTNISIEKGRKMLDI